MLVENTLTPGAVTFGFRSPSSVRGPPELNEATNANVVSGTLAGTIVALTGEGAARNVGVSLCRSSMKGIVATSIAGVKNPSALLTTPNATACAACAFVSFWSNEQVPRARMTNAPAALAGKSVASQP